MDEAEISEDALFDGALRILQPRHGYRFGIDSLLLAASVPSTAEGLVVDVGCGVGVVALAVAHRVRGLLVRCVEVQADLAEIARRNVSLNGLDRRVDVWEGDIRRLDLETDADLVLMNPPFYPLSHGRLNPSVQRAAARHEVFGTLAELITSAARCLDRRGVLRLIYPAEELPRLLDVVGGLHMKAVALRPIHPFKDARANLVILDVRQSGRREMQIMPGMVIFDAPGRYTPIVQAILEGRHDG